MGQKRHPDVAGQTLPRDNFVSQLSRNCPHRGGYFERGRKALSSGGEIVWEASWETIWARAIASQKIVSRQRGDNFCRETSRCLAGPSGLANFRKIARKVLSANSPATFPREFFGPCPKIHAQNFGKEKTNKHKEFWRDTPWCASRLSQGHVPSVL